MIVFILTAFSIALSVALGQNTVGSTCGNGSQCSKNEYCLLKSGLDPPCPLRTCHCLPNHSVQMDCSFQYVCSVVHLSIGDVCCQWTASSVYVNLPHGTYCSRKGRVECQPSFRKNGSFCQAADAALPGKACQSHDDCANAGMICWHKSRKCQCPIESMIYDYDKQRCVKRDFGDACLRDDMCHSFASTWIQGYTYNSAACSPQGTCHCGNYTETLVSFLDHRNGGLQNRTICVPPTAAANLTVGDECHPDPIYSSVAEAVVKICRAGLVCYKCPGEKSIGKCRALLGAVSHVDNTEGNNNITVIVATTKVPTPETNNATIIGSPAETVERSETPGNNNDNSNKGNEASATHYNSFTFCHLLYFGIFLIHLYDDDFLV